MGLKITRTQDNSKKRPITQLESSNFWSARNEHMALTSFDLHPAITVEVREFADEDQNLSKEAGKLLFEHLWQKLETGRRCDMTLDFSSVNEVDPRFREKLIYLRKRTHHFERSLQFLNVSTTCDPEGLFADK